MCSNNLDREGLLFAAATPCRLLQVKGLLLGSEVDLAKRENYLKGAYVLVGERRSGWQGVWAQSRVAGSKQEAPWSLSPEK